MFLKGTKDFFTTSAAIKLPHYLRAHYQLQVLRMLEGDVPSDNVSHRQYQTTNPVSRSNQSHQRSQKLAPVSRSNVFTTAQRLQILTLDLAMLHLIAVLRHQILSPVQVMAHLIYGL